MTSHCGWRCIISHKQRMWCVSYMIHSFCLSAQSCLTLCKPSMVTHSSILVQRIPMDRGVWQATVHGVAKSQTWPKWFSRHAWIVVSHSPLSMEFSRWEYWKDCHFLLQGIFPAQGLNLCLLHLLHWQMNSLPQHHLGSPSLLHWTFTMCQAQF